MAIRKAMRTDWEHAVMECALRDDVDIYPEQRIICKLCELGNKVLGDMCLIYGDKEYPELIVTRIESDMLLLPAMLHLLEQRKRLARAGINMKLMRKEGILQCVYSNACFTEPHLSV